MFIDPSRGKSVGEKGKKLTRVTATPGRESITLMACVSASGEKHPPLIIFSGKKLQSISRAPNVDKNLTLAISENGWMTTEIFNCWFDIFCKQVSKLSLLLIYDGHKTQISLDLITKARNKNISILKLPAHTTDVIQPLDKCCFRPLKAQWDKRLVEIQRMTGATRISKASFTQLVDELWQTSLSPENIKSGFKSTGIYPLDRTKYPVKRFCSQMLASYKLQNSPSKRLAIASTSSASTNCSTTPSNNFSTLQLNLDTSGSQTEEHTPSICTPILSVSSFTTVGISKTSTIVSQSTASTSFEDLLSS